jgi:hypothetical protein
VPLAETTLFFEAVNEVQPRARDYERWSTDPDDDFKPWPEATPPSPLLRKRADDVKPIDALARSLFPADMAELRSGSRRHEIARKKSLIAQRAIRDGHSLVSIAAWMSCTPQGVHRLLHRKSE